MTSYKLQFTNALRSTAFLTATVVAIALINRIYVLIDRGGLEFDQVKWASENYFGGLTQFYLGIRDSILAWEAEKKLWLYMPGYPAFLALLHSLKDDLRLVRIVQIVLDSLAVLPLYFVLFRLGRSAYLAVLGCLIYALAPWWSAGSTYLLGESLLPAMMIALIAAMVFSRDQPERSNNWLFLGLLGAFVSFFRSEMMPLVAPLAVWALLVTPKGQRTKSVIFVVSSFVLPLSLWAARNYYVHGQFLLTPPVKWYAAWSGLGQLPNNFGYFTSDWTALDVLKANGLKQYTTESEAFWRLGYLKAWQEHPDFVISTILYRLKMILTQVDHGGFRVFHLMAVVSTIGIGWLLWKRRWSDAFLVILPMAFALGSLGILYVETRYVRYAGLTYVLALPATLTAIFDVIYCQWPRRLPMRPEPDAAKF